MTATNRHRSSEKSAPSAGDDASNSQTRYSECLGVVANALFYTALIVAVGFAAFHLQGVAEEIRQTNARQEKSARRIAEMTTELDSVSLDMAVVKSLVNGLESAMRVTQTKLKGALGQIQKNELDARKTEEALQKLQMNPSSEEGADSPSPSVSDVTSKVESLLSKYNATESALAAQGQEVEAVKTGLKREMEALKSCLGVILSNMTALFDGHTELALRDSNVVQQGEDLQESLGVVEGGGGSSSSEPDLK